MAATAGHLGDHRKRGISTTVCEVDGTIPKTSLSAAIGNKRTQLIRNTIQRCFFWLGCFVQKHPWKVIAAALLISTLSCVGLPKIESDFGQLWVANGDRIHERPNDPTMVAPFEAGYQALIQTAEDGEDDVLTERGLLRHVELLSEIAGFSVNVDGLNWTLRDICFKNRIFDDPFQSPSMQQHESRFERLNPCVWITPANCFWEGGKPLGPDPPLGYDDLNVGSYFIDTSHNLPLTWASFDPMRLFEVLSAVADTGMLQSLAERGGISNCYIDRPCIDPYDPDCPSTAPNAIDYCTYFHKYKAFLQEHNRPYELFTIEKVINDGECANYRRSFMRFLRNRTAALDFMTEDELPKFPTYGSVLKSGCEAVTRDILRWPQEMIIGGAKAKSGRENEEITAEALQTTFLLASSEDLFKRFNNPASRVWKELRRTNRSDFEWNVKKAEEVILAWQRAFTRRVNNHPLNFRVDNGIRSEKRIVHSLASTSLTDLLAESSGCNYVAMAAGFILMITYALLSEMKFNGFNSVKIISSVCLGLAGVLTVSTAIISGLALAGWIGIHFNAATTQLLPFLVLGISVDHVFFLLHNYRDVTRRGKPDEIGALMKETGIPVLLTSSIAISSFLFGTFLPFPALRAFCVQAAIALIFTLIAVMAVFPAILAVDLRRRNASNDQDFKSIDDGEVVSNENDEDGNEVNAESGIFRVFLRSSYIPFIKSWVTKVAILVVCTAMLTCGLVGIPKLTTGLDLSDLLPKHTAPAAFLEAYDKYFDVYPMHVVLRSEDFDFSQNQHLIESLRSEIARSKHVLKLENGEPSGKLWLQAFRDWLQHLQEKMDAFKEQHALKSQRNVTQEIAKSDDRELQVAYSLLCSHGWHSNCARVFSTRLIDVSGTVNPEGFYNYLHAWYEYDSPSYAASQADFRPLPAKLQANTRERHLVFVPPTEKIVHSRIPFHLRGLKDAAAILEMIEEMRGICAKYSALGLDCFPQGFVFSFWDQFLHLKRNLLFASALASVIVFVLTSVLLVDPRAACYVVLTVVLTTLELAGFLGLAGIELNPISAVALISAVGLGSNFAVHVVFAFLTSTGDRNDRMGAAIEKSFVPVVHGAATTLLGVGMIAFSPFPFIANSFFAIISALVIIALVNALILLPVLLAIAGPPSEVHLSGEGSPADRR